MIICSLTPALDGGGWSPPHTSRFTHGNDQVVPIVQEGGWAAIPVRTSAENFAPLTGIRSPDRPARNEMLYRRRYPGPLEGCKHATISKKGSLRFYCVPNNGVYSGMNFKYTTFRTPVACPSKTNESGKVYRHSPNYAIKKITKFFEARGEFSLPERKPR